MSSNSWVALLVFTSVGAGCSASVEGRILDEDQRGSDSDSQGGDGHGPAGDGGDATGGDSSGGDSNGGDDQGDSDGGDGSPGASITSANILFSGHSLLENPIPAITTAIADDKGRGNDWERHNIPGSPLRVRTRGGTSGPWVGYQQGSNRDGDGMDIIAELANPTRLAAGEHYDTLVITERHDPLDTLVWENSVGYLRDYHDRVAEHADSRTLFWQAWPDIDKSDPGRWISYVRAEVGVWECIAAKVNASLASEDRPAAVTVAPGALVYAAVVEAALAGDVPGIGGTQRQRLDALFSDNVHPTEVASYALAAAVYAAVYRASPEGAAVADFAAADTLAALERIAWEVVNTYPTATRSRRDLGECRTTVIPAVCAEYYAIRDRNGDCNGATASDGPLRWPDPELPLR